MVISLSHGVILIVIMSYVYIVESMMFPIYYVMDMMCSIGFILYNLPESPLSHGATVIVRVPCVTMDLELEGYLS